MTEIRAKDVTVKKLFRACCHLRGCGSIGTPHAAKRLADIQDAAAENLSRVADEAELWRLQEPPDAPPPPPPPPRPGLSLLPAAPTEARSAERREAAHP
ncbi:MAG TPA: hypothetical protein VF933_02510 [Streptosporangiaceae bacterium]